MCLKKWLYDKQITISVKKVQPMYLQGILRVEVVAGVVDSPTSMHSQRWSSQHGQPATANQFSCSSMHAAISSAPLHSMATDQTQQTILAALPNKTSHSKLV